MFTINWATGDSKIPCDIQRLEKRRKYWKNVTIQMFTQEKT